MQPWSNFIQEASALLSSTRQRMPKIAGSSRHLLLAEQSYLNFISNDYLGLSQNTQLIQAANLASLRYGTGSTGAASLSGYSQIQATLSQELADWLGFDKGLIFNSGYQLAVGIYAPLCDQNTRIWLDKNCHASHIDGILLSRAKFNTFRAENIQEVLLQIDQQASLRHILITEGSFSMDGSCTYLPQLLEFKQSSQANLLLIIDDAHGIAALGDKGCGTLEQLGLNYQAVDLLMGTLGKGFATHGGFICGNAALIDYLQQTIRSQIYSTCLPAAILAAASSSLALIKSPQGYLLRQQLSANIAYFKTQAAIYQLPLYNSELNISPIQLLIFNDSTQVQAIYQYLKDAQILIAKIVYPTVAKSCPRLRISLSAAHSRNDIDTLCRSLDEALKNGK